jgi:hypothetical protein
MTDNEYERLAAVAEGDGMTLGEWVREVLLAGGPAFEAGLTFRVARPSRSLWRVRDFSRLLPRPREKNPAGERSDRDVRFRQRGVFPVKCPTR